MVGRQVNVSFHEKQFCENWNDGYEQNLFKCQLLQLVFRSQALSLSLFLVTLFLGHTQWELLARCQSSDWRRTDRVGFESWERVSIFRAETALPPSPPSLPLSYFSISPVQFD